MNTVSAALYEDMQNHASLAKMPSNLAHATHPWRTYHLGTTWGEAGALAAHRHDVQGTFEKHSDRQKRAVGLVFSLLGKACA